MQKALSERQNRLQSRLLVGLVGTSLLLIWASEAYRFSTASGAAHANATLFVQATAVSLTFAGLVWALRAGTLAAALLGAAICCELTIASATAAENLLHTALAPLMTLFALTFAATRFGKRAPSAATSVREARHGRSAAQVIANLGAAPLVLVVLRRAAPDVLLAGALVAALAVLVEATADTVSSELGQLFGGAPYLLTTGERVARGTDGAISLLGTGAGMLAGALVAGAGAWALPLGRREALAALVGGIVGLFFDSLLGATAERRGWCNNDLVNFSSTVFAAAVAYGLVRFL